MFEQIDTDIQQNIDYMTKSHLRNVMQLAIFYTGSNQIYAINISKIQSFLIKDDIDIVKTPSSDKLITGVINLRGEMISVVNLDHWIDESATLDDYKVIIICNYNERKVGILVKNIIKIEEKNSSDLKLPSSSDPKVSYITETIINDEEKLCIIFDAEKLLFDIKKDDVMEGSTIYDISSFGKLDKVNTKKKLLVAEDSSIVIEKLTEFFESISIDFEIYDNGEKLINRLNNINVEDIGLIITDIEMPIVNGYQVIKFVKESQVFDNIPIISLTSMTNQGVMDKVKQLGALDLINKADLQKIHQYLKQYL